MNIMNSSWISNNLIGDSWWLWGKDPRTKKNKSSLHCSAEVQTICGLVCVCVSVCVCVLGCTKVDMLSHPLRFFISPTFDPSGIEREMKALCVDREFSTLCRPPKPMVSCRFFVISPWNCHVFHNLSHFPQHFFVFSPLGYHITLAPVEAVDSESTNYSTEDGWRLLQVLKAWISTRDWGSPMTPTYLLYHLDVLDDGTK